MKTRDVIWLSGLIVALAAVVSFYVLLERFQRESEPVPIRSLNLEEFSVLLYRRGCPAGCPVYAVLAKGSGLLQYEGVENVATIGSVETRLTEEQAHELFVEVYRSGMLGMADVYQPGEPGCFQSIANEATITLGVTKDGKTHTLTYYYGCANRQIALEKLADRIDAVLNTRQWVRGGGVTF